MSDKKLPSDTVENMFGQYKKIEQAQYAKLQYPNSEKEIHYPPQNEDYGWMKLAIMKKFVQDENSDDFDVEKHDMIKDYVEY